MRKFIRLEPRRFLYVVERGTSAEQIERMQLEFNRTWDDATLLIVTADEYLDATGQPIDTIHPSELRGNP